MRVQEWLIENEMMIIVLNFGFIVSNFKVSKILGNGIIISIMVICCVQIYRLLEFFEKEEICIMIKEIKEF